MSLILWDTVQCSVYVPVIMVKIMIGIQTTASEVRRGWEAAEQSRPLVVTLFSSTVLTVSTISSMASAVAGIRDFS